MLFEVVYSKGRGDQYLLNSLTNIRMVRKRILKNSNQSMSAMARSKNL